MDVVKQTNKDIAHLLRSVAAVYLLTGANRFRIIAYEKAADTVEHYNRELKDLWESGQLVGIPGIGPSISKHLDEYFKKGENSYLVKQIQKIPSPVFEFMQIPGIGPKRAYRLAHELSLTKSTRPVEDLRRAARAGKIAKLESFGDRSQKEILESIRLYLEAKSKPRRMLLIKAYTLAQQIVMYMEQQKEVKEASAMGSVRRMVSTVGDIDIVAVCSEKDSQRVVEHFISYPGRARIEDKGDRKAAIVLTGGVHVDLRVCSPDIYGSMLQYFTGSKAHNIQLREYALKRGYSLSEYGIKKIKNQKSKIKIATQNSKLQKFQNESKFYNFLGLEYIPPEIREGTDEIQIAAKKKLPHFVEISDVKGDLQVHSSYDLEPSHDVGVNTFEEILKKANQLNYEYVAFTDHNPSVGNHSEDAIVEIMKKRKDAIMKLKKVGRTNYFISCEVDILPDGRIALPIKALEQVDFILVSIHSSFRQGKESMTKRILQALSFPKVKVFAHPTARLIDRRPEIDVDWPVVFKECAKRDIAIEINSYPDRLDLPDTLVREACDFGVKFTLGTDAHHVDHMDYMFLGVAVARRGWLEKKNILNNLNFSDFSKWVFKKG